MNTDAVKTGSGRVVGGRMKRRMTRALMVLAGVVVVALGIGAIWLGGDPASAADVPVFVVARGPLVISVTESGTIRSREKVVVKSRVEGRTTILWLIDEGKQVNKGDLLLQLDSSKLEDDKARQDITVLNANAAFIRARENLVVTKSQAESNIAQAELDNDFAKLDREKYHKLEAEPEEEDETGEEGKSEETVTEYRQELDQARADITIAQEEHERAVDTYESSLELAREGYITQTELKGDELSAKRAKLKLELAEGKLKLLQEFTHKRRLAELDSDVEQAEKALERARSKARADIIQGEADLAAKESELTRQKTKFEKIGDQITKCRITAPVAGMAVYATTGRGNWRHNVEPLDEGQEVRERQELIHLPTTSSMTADVKIHESSLTKIGLGMPVRVVADALPERVFWGRVGKIALLPDAQSAWLNPDLKVYPTEIHLDGDAGELRTGMTCRAEIIVERHEDAVYVPVQSVLRVQGVSTVYVNGSNGPQARQVQVGLDNNRKVHIVSGLQEGERVLLAPPLAASEVSEDRIGSGGQGASESRPAATTMPAASAPSHPTSRPASRPAFDFAKLRNMSPEERKKWRESLTREQRENLDKLRSRRGAGAGRPGRDTAGRQ